MSHKLRNAYDTSNDLRSEAMHPSTDLLRDVTENILLTYGRVIWSEQEPRLTRINENYPRFFIFTDPKDFERIRAYLYYWILYRAIRSSGTSKKTPSSSKSPGKTHKPGGTRGSGRAARPSTYSYPDLEYDEVNSSSEYEDSDSDQVSQDQEIISDSASIQDQTESFPRSFQAPVAQMVPLSSRTRSVKRRAVSSPDEPALQLSVAHKRLRSSLGKEHRSQGLHPNVEPEQSADRLSYAVPQIPHVEGVPRNFPNLSRSLTSHNREGLEFSTHGLSLNPEALAGLGGGRNPASDRSDDREDSVQGSLAAPRLSTRTNLQSKHPSLTVKLKLISKGAEDDIPTGTRQSTEPTPLTRQAEKSGNHCKLAFMLLDILKTGDPENQDLAILKDTITLINTIRYDDAILLNRVEKNAPDRRQTILNQWLECVRAFTTFRQMTGFKGDKNSREAFIKGLARELKKAAGLPLVRMSSVISEWRQEPDFTVAGFSKDLAHVLFGMATWMGTMELGELAEDLTTFNERLFAWFE
ncbi:uncharacterized protein K460DRAFT_430414 [Cucurbitaria berberidis CBS 394.84]|uniref:Uncharacterized protein n=1 Tax=Cucurbitaria berberidis CBS 394.84 TaxID=1168544 RepID=A0A9P4GHS0_9PLEO|nr:uncharacterized protein K460DRAFT_430414 [Cucurbitaria berberidis CBS 394.84]KAF1845532.1 hypothetical protein K460DRAFT_430414 [Cucurbitaria berberidis CBS 394.84]